VRKLELAASDLRDYVPASILAPRGTLTRITSSRAIGSGVTP
jgi:hypothetical protein